MKEIKKIILKGIDIILSPCVFLSAVTLKFVRTRNIRRMPIAKKILLCVGVFPIRDHYYEPLFHPKHLKNPLSEKRCLPGINWNVDEQLEILREFNFQQEFKDIPDGFTNETSFYFNNGAFASGDAEYWYSIIRLKKPKKIIEIGSGNSTKMARLAIEANRKEDANYQCKHICIEPYEMPWLEKIAGIEVIREKVENIDVAFFKQLDANDILFIDSSHVIRPQGDVVFEYLEILPTLNSGVIVHIHDHYCPIKIKNAFFRL
jgi:hypothetical protein